MIKRIVTSKPKNAKIVEARQWSQEMNDYVKKKYPQFVPEVYVERYGNFNKMHFYAQFETIADLDKFQAETNSDQEFVALFMKGTEFFIDGSIETTLIESL